MYQTDFIYIYLQSKTMIYQVLVILDINVDYEN